MARFRVETIALSPSFSEAQEKDFLGGVCDILQADGVDMIIPATTNTIFRTYPRGALAAPYGTFLLDLRSDEGVLFSKLNSSHRRHVRNAAKDGIHISSGPEYAEQAYILVRDTFKRSKLPFMSWAAFRKMVNGLGENVKIFVARYNNIVQGCAVIPFSLRCAYYVYGGSVPTPASGAMQLLHWEAIRTFRDLGVHQYDFVGGRVNPEPESKQQGIMTFKARFGADFVQGYIWKYPFKTWKFKLYSIAARLRSGGDIVDQERKRLGIGALHAPSLREASA